jgi:solute carrier family 25 carnitine/acylcarnitine transporter 20/29
MGPDVFRRHSSGSLAPLASVTVVRTVSFSIYSKSKQVYASMLRPVLGDNLISPPNTPGMKPCNPIYWFLSGATAGGAITFIACMLLPWELWAGLAG